MALHRSLQRRDLIGRQPRAVKRDSRRDIENLCCPQQTELGLAAPCPTHQFSANFLVRGFCEKMYAVRARLAGFSAGGDRTEKEGEKKQLDHANF